MANEKPKRPQELLRSVSTAGKLNGHGLSDWAIWSVVEQSPKQIGIERFGADDLRKNPRQAVSGVGAGDCDRREG